MTPLLEQVMALAPLAALATLPTWVVAAAPFIAALLTWHVAVLKHRHERARDLRDLRLRESEHLLREQEIVHNENVSQTDVQTRRFVAIMDSYDARVDDLSAEVKELRKEVVNLRRVIDKQREVCNGCDRMNLWVSRLTAYSDPEPEPDAST